MNKKETPLFENWKALGTTWGVFFWCEEEKDFTTIEKEIKEEILSFEKKFSRFREDSLVSLLNKEGKVPYDTELFEMLSSGDEFSVKTEGAFSLFIKKDLEEKGYGEKRENKKAGSRKEGWKEEGGFIHLHSSQGLDLGGIGKGVLIDKIAKLLKEKYSLSSFLINGGGDLYGTDESGEPIEVFLENPLESGKTIGKVKLFHESLCCSSSFKRRWIKDGVEKNHFISPEGSEVWAASFVIEKNATKADTFATALCILTQTPKKLEKVMKENKEVDFLVINGGGDVYNTKRFEGIL